MLTARARATREPHFEGLDTRRHAAPLGMWIFLAGEILLFSVMFALYAGLRAEWPAAFAEGAGLTVLWMGTAGTVLLLIASFLVATSVHAIRTGRSSVAAGLLWGAGGLGLAFLALKGWEYARHVAEGLGPYGPSGAALERIHESLFGADAFWTLYYVMTGAHALHVLGGVALLVWIGWRARAGDYDAVWHTPLGLGGMYWHFVDVVWLFMWPCFYLMRG